MSYPNNEDNDVSPDNEHNPQKAQVLRQILSTEARSRLNNIKIVKPELVTLVENYLLSLISQGKLNSQISDEQLKQILQSIQQPKRDFKINHISFIKIYLGNVIILFI